MILRPALLAAIVLGCPPAFAEKADRDKPMLLEANRISIDDAKKQQILEGDVVISKGTLMIKAARIIVSEDRYGFQKGIAFAPPGGKASFRQKREGREDYVEGEAERIEYDSNSEIAELFHRAHIRAGEDEVRGDYIWYDAVSEKFLASAGEASDPKGATPRVRAVIQPRSKGSEPSRPSARGDNLQLRSAGDIDPKDPR
ncbi:lipopolysaccharide transport periplasmic protein LptA [Azonexus sp.]|uniref:lipopolysaccharide transport periplasmic protein LptA n=1 Tax=Azonexus sp. TaxID=1872668 RepID=UPI0035B4534C